MRAIGYGRFRGDYDLAIADYSEGMRLDPKIVAAYAGRGASYLRKGNVDLALKDLNEGLRLNPNNSAVHNGLGGYHLAKGEYDLCAGGIQHRHSAAAPIPLCLQISRRGL